jgi:dephospho-CoA kinase
MLKVAVTGNIGSGKTTVCKIFSMLGIPVFYADQEAKKLYGDPDILNHVTDQFGKQILTPDNTISFKALASIIFNDKEALEFINKLIHPKVYDSYKKWIQSHRDKPYCIQESALVFETGSNKNFDQIILVQAPENLLSKRVMKRDGVTHEQVQARLEKQMKQSVKAEKSDFSINNDNTSLLIPQVLAVHEALLAQSAKSK